MINLKDFVEDRLQENIVDKHFRIEFDIRKQLNYSLLEINEKYGSYKGQLELVIELSKNIWKDIKNETFKEPFNYILDKEDLEDFGLDNIFFEKLKIYFDYNKNSYKPELSKYIKEKKIFDNVVIFIDLNEIKSYEDIVSFLTHEFTHAWDNYSTYFKNSKLKLIDIIDKKYKEISNLKDKTSIESICKVLLYLISNIERKAYISEFTSALDSKDYIINSYEDALEIFKSTDAYIQYFGYYEVFNNLSEKEQEEFREIYNKINNTNLNFNKIYKKIKSQLDKIIEKILTNIPKIYYDYYIKHQVKEGSEVRINSSYIKFYNEINNYISKLMIKKSLA